MDVGQYRRAIAARYPESAIQRALIEHIHTRGVPGLLWWHTPNEGIRSKAQRAIAMALGMRAGVADLLFLHRGRFYSLELKAPGRTSTSAQEAWQKSVNEAGGFAAEAVGLGHAIAVLETWGLLRGKSGTNG